LRIRIRWKWTSKNLLTILVQSSPALWMYSTRKLRVLIFAPKRTTGLKHLFYWFYLTVDSNRFCETTPKKMADFDCL